MEQRLIDANALLKWLAHFTGLEKVGMPQVVEVICTRPTIDAVPVVRGEWVDKYKSGHKPSRGVVCSECDCWNERTSSYCPSCGAKMDRGIS